MNRSELGYIAQSINSLEELNKILYHLRNGSLCIVDNEFLYTFEDKDLDKVVRAKVESTLNDKVQEIENKIAKFSCLPNSFLDDSYT